MLRSWFLLLLSCAVVSSFCACTGSDKPQFEAGDPLDTSPNSDPFVGAGGGGGSLSFPQFIPEDAYTGSGNGLPDAQEGTNGAQDGTNGVQDVAEAEDASPAYADASPIQGLSCEQILACAELCVFLEEAERAECEAQCVGTGNLESQLAGQAVLDCASLNGCIIAELECWQSVCAEEWEECTGGSGGSEGDEVDPTKPPLTCGGTDGVVCPEPPSSPLPVSFEHVTDQQPPALVGGELLDGHYGLTNVQVYSSSMLAGGALPLNFDFEDFGTQGGIRIEGDAWSFFSQLELKFSTELGGNVFTGVREGGGCISVHEGQVFTDILQCYEGTPSESEVPTSFPYEVSGSDVKLLVRFPVSGIKSALEGSAAGGLASVLLVNDLQVLITLSLL